MRIKIFAVGKPKLAFAKSGVAEYTSRLHPFAGDVVQFVKASSKENESAELLERSEGCLRVVLDERGEELSSRELAGRITQWELDGVVKKVALLIGGADGHTNELRAAAHWRWSLSRLTLQHEMALVLVLEQLYRAYTIKEGMPYHRD
jgi:23S rRNA (pseudouridine1915-N3)-methyltransferase